MKKLNRYEAWYMEQLNNIIENGQVRGDRTGTGVISLPHLTYTHDLRETHPLMSGRQFVYDQPITEMIWMMSGSSNIQYLKDNGCPFWNGFATKSDIVIKEELERNERIRLHANNRGSSYVEALTALAMVPVNEVDALLDNHQIPNMRDITVKKGELGPVYGVQWRYWPNPDGTTFDQLTYALNTLKADPNSRRVVVDCWNPSFLPDPKKDPSVNALEGKMALTPCHFAFGFYTWELSEKDRLEEMLKRVDFQLRDQWISGQVDPFKKEQYFNELCEMHKVPTHYLDITFTMRSNDWILGQPANMNMYSALLMMFAQQLNMIPRFVNYTGWDCHVYRNHLEGAETLNERWNTGEYKYSTVKLNLSKKDDLFGYHHTDFVMDGEYKPGEKIKFPIAI